MFILIVTLLGTLTFVTAPERLESVCEHSQKLLGIPRPYTKWRTAQVYWDLFAEGAV